MTINVSGQLMDLSVPKVMGILNVTPDSFYVSSRSLDEEAIRNRVKKITSEGAEIIDIGGCSTRPGFTPPSSEEEWTRVDLGCRICRELAPEIPLSIDTFRHEIALRAIQKWHIEIINDISGGEADPEMFATIAKARVAYVLTLNRLDAERAVSGDITADAITTLSWKINQLHSIGVNDVIVDPGFGFAKTMKENFRLLDELEELANMGYPVLVGVSRKSMIYTTLGITPEESLAGTVALNSFALDRGANILRVHDVKEGMQTVKLYTKMKNLTP